MSFFPHDFLIHQRNNEDQDHQGGLMFMNRSMSFSQVNHHHQSYNGIDEDEGLVNQDDELSDDCGGGSSLGGEKKKRLKREQVRELERSFELGNKLDSERKQQLAKSLGLQPRQIAIWFQNRRARWKTKQLEKDYNLLKKQFASAMADNDNLQSQNKQLRHELQVFRGRDSIQDGTTNIKKEAGYSSWSNNASEKSCEISLLDSSRTLTSMSLFPSLNMPATGPHFLDTSLRTDPQPSMINQNISEDDGLCNILCGIDDQTTGAWSWAEQQHHFSQ